MPTSNPPNQIANPAAAIPVYLTNPAGASPAPAVINSSNATTYNNSTVNVASGSTLTIDGSAWAGLTLGLAIQVGQPGSATLAWSGSAIKENASGTSGASYTLVASGIYVLTQSPTGTPIFRLVGGASL